MVKDEWNVLPPIRLHCDGFLMFPIGDPRQLGAPNTLYRMLLTFGDAGRPRWHLVDRQHSFGRQVLFARPIVIILGAA